MHNIALVFIRMGQWEEAIVSLEYIMSEQADHRAGLHLVVCCKALEDSERMKNAFTLLLSVPLNAEEDDKYDPEQVRVINSTLHYTNSSLTARQSGRCCNSNRY